MPHEHVYGICENKCLIEVEPKANTDAVKTRVGTLEGEMDNVQPRVATLEGEMNSVEGRATSLEGRMSIAETTLNNCIRVGENIPLPLTAKLYNSDQGFGYLIKNNVVAEQRLPCIYTNPTESRNVSITLYNAHTRFNILSFTVSGRNILNNNAIRTIGTFSETTPYETSITKTVSAQYGEIIFVSFARSGGTDDFTHYVSVKENNNTSYVGAP